MLSLADVQGTSPSIRSKSCSIDFQGDCGKGTVPSRLGEGGNVRFMISVLPLRSMVQTAKTLVLSV